MAAPKLIDTGRQADFADLQTALISYASSVGGLQSPDQVLDQLHAITTCALPLSVLGAVRFPIKSGDWEAIQVGKSAFIHKEVPKEWWEQYQAIARGKFRPALFLAATSMAPHTWTEVRRMFQPVGIDQWTYELALKHGMRDGLTCPVGGRWVLVFWSRKELSNVVTPAVRIMLYAAASFAVLRLNQLVDPDPSLIGARDHLTPRELAVLRLVSTGSQCREVAQALCLGEETVRTHLKKAQGKLGARGRTQAVAEALRQGLIP